MTKWYDRIGNTIEMNIDTFMGLIYTLNTFDLMALVALFPVSKQPFIEIPSS